MFRLYVANGKYYELPFKRLKIWEDGILIRDFQACINMGNKVGYYEHVLGNFFPKSNKPEDDNNITNVYTVYEYKNGVSYIEKNVEYIDTGVDPFQISLFDEVMKGRCKHDNT